MPARGQPARSYARRALLRLALTMPAALSLPYLLAWVLVEPGPKSPIIVGSFAAAGVAAGLVSAARPAAGAGAGQQPLVQPLARNVALSLLAAAAIALLIFLIVVADFIAD